MATCPRGGDTGAGRSSQARKGPRLWAPPRTWALRAGGQVANETTAVASRALPGEPLGPAGCSLTLAAVGMGAAPRSRTGMGGTPPCPAHYGVPGSTGKRRAVVQGRPSGLDSGSAPSCTDFGSGLWMIYL